MYKVDHISEINSIYIASHQYHWNCLNSPSVVPSPVPPSNTSPELSSAAISVGVRSAH